MAGFLYYKSGKPKDNQVTLDELDEWGLSYAFDVAPAPVPCVQGPDGGSGFTFADESRLDGKTVGHYADKQEWRKIPGSELYIGCFKDAVPTANDLSRQSQLPGYMFPLADGKQWRIPVVRQFLEGQDKPVCALPHYLDIDDEGNEIPGQVAEVHRYLWEATEDYTAALVGPERDEGDEIKVDWWDKAAILLGANYVVGKTELALARVFDTSNSPMTVCLLAIDYPVYQKRRDAQKKTSSTQTPDGQPMSDGAAA